MAYEFQTTVDCAEPHEQADWWAEALGWQVEPSDEAFIRRMVDEGRAREEDTTTHRGALVWRVGAAIRHPESGQRVLFQTVPERKTVKNRLHWDIRTEGKREEEVVRLTGLGAEVLYSSQQGPFTWTVMKDKEGNEFCVS
jgi:hypothetical protein